jgi:hypothetical protein
LENNKPTENEPVSVKNIKGNEKKIEYTQRQNSFEKSFPSKNDPVCEWSDEDKERLKYSERRLWKGFIKNV